MLNRIEMLMTYAMLCYAKSLQSCPTLSDPIDGSPPGSVIPGILQERILGWVAISFSNAWKEKRETEVAQSCLTLSDPMDCSLPGSSVHGIFQARVLEWGAIAFSSWWHKYEKKKNCKASCLNVITTRKSYALDQDYWLLATWKKQVPQIRKRDSYLRFTIPSTCTTSIFGVSLSLSPVHRDLEFIGFNPNLIKFTIDISLGLLPLVCAGLLSISGVSSPWPAPSPHWPLLWLEC